MRRVNLLALAAATVLAFIASSLWYSPLLFGHQFLELSGVSQSQPSAMKALLELIRTSILAYVIARLLLMLNIADWKGALRLGLLAMDRLPCHPSHRIHALAERTMATGRNS